MGHRRSAAPGKTGGSLGQPDISATIQGKVFEGRCVGEAGDAPEARLGNARTHAVDEAELSDRSVDRALAHDLLHLVQDRRAALVVQLACLLHEQSVEIRVTAVSERAARDGVALQPCRGIARILQAQPG
jgi:hypothetical protein